MEKRKKIELMIRFPVPGHSYPEGILASSLGKYLGEIVYDKKDAEYLFIPGEEVCYNQKNIKDIQKHLKYLKSCFHQPIKITNQEHLE